MFELIILVILATDKRSITIRDNGSTFAPGVFEKTDVTSGKLRLFTTDKSNPVVELILTTQELDEFLNTTDGVTIPFSDSRFFNLEFPEDNFYDTRLILNDTHTSNNDPFSIEKTLSERVYEMTASVYLCNTNILDLQYLTQSVISLDTLERLSASNGNDRELRWRDTYEFIYNYVLNGEGND